MKIFMCPRYHSNVIWSVKQQRTLCLKTIRWRHEETFGGAEFS